MKLDMKIYHQIVAILLVFTLFNSSVKAQNQELVDTTYQHIHYQYRVDFFRQMPNQKNEIVFLGNGMVESGKWQELVNKKGVVNRGINEDITFGILARLDEVLASKPQKIFFLCGVNDINKNIPHEKIVSNFKKIIQQVQTQSPKTKLYIQSVLPVNEKMLGASFSKINNEKIQALNKQLAQLSKESKLVYINLHPIFSDENGSLKKEFTNDGLNLLQPAYIVWANYLKQLKAL